MSIRVLARGPSQKQAEPLAKAGSVWQLPGAIPFPSLPPRLLSGVGGGLSVGLGPRGVYQVQNRIHWAPLYETSLSWKQQVLGVKMG